MRHLLIALVIGLLTIGISVFVLSDSDESYESDAKVSQSISLGETFEGVNYDFKPISFDCSDFDSIDDEETQQGCVLNAKLTNTTNFEQILDLDGDRAITADGVVYESSDELSNKFVEDNGLSNDVDVGETVQGGIFFDIPVDTKIASVEVFQNATADPIVIEL